MRALITSVQHGRPPGPRDRLAPCQRGGAGPGRGAGGHSVPAPGGGPGHTGGGGGGGSHQAQVGTSGVVNISFMHKDKTMHVAAAPCTCGLTTTVTGPPWPTPASRGRWWGSAWTRTPPASPPCTSPRCRWGVTITAVLRIAISLQEKVYYTYHCIL